MIESRQMQRALMTTALLSLLTPASLFAQKKDDDDDAPVSTQSLPNTGQTLTPLAPRASRFEMMNPDLADNPNYVVGQAVTTVTSPDRRTLLVLTSGYNLVNFSTKPQPGSPNNPTPQLGDQNSADSNEYVFVYDISQPLPVKKQVIQVPNTYAGIVFDPTGKYFYVSGGKNDNVHLYALDQTGLWAEEAGSPIALGHAAGNGLAVAPAAAGIAVTNDGKKLVVANYYNDSISILTKTDATWTKTGELDLRPGKIDPAQHGVAGGGLLT